MRERERKIEREKARREKEREKGGARREREGKWNRYLRERATKDKCETFDPTNVNQ